MGETVTVNRHEITLTSFLSSQWILNHSCSQLSLLHPLQEGLTLKVWLLVSVLLFGQPFPTLVYHLLYSALDHAEYD